MIARWRRRQERVPWSRSGTFAVTVLGTALVLVLALWLWRWSAVHQGAVWSWPRYAISGAP